MIQIGDTVICVENGVIGTVIKQYYPIACEQQTMGYFVQMEENIMHQHDYGERW